MAAPAPEEPVEPVGPSAEERAQGPFPPWLAPALGILAALLGVAAAGYARSLATEGLPVTAAAIALVMVPFLAFLLAVGFAPAEMQRLLGRRSPVDLRQRAHVFALVFLAAMLFVVVGVNSVVGGAFAWETVALRDGDPDAVQVSGEAVFENLLVNAVFLLAPPFVWLTVVHGVTLQGAARKLGLRSEGAPRAALLGVAFSVLVILGLAAVSVLVTQGGVEMPENEQALAIARSLTVAGALAVAVASGFTEEVFFRGFLMPRIGLLPHALVFAAAHLSYVHVLQVVATFLLALGFGWLYRATGNLWSAVAAHFAFNAIMLLATRVAPPA